MSPSRASGPSCRALGREKGEGKREKIKQEHTERGFGCFKLSSESNGKDLRYGTSLHLGREAHMVPGAERGGSLDGLQGGSRAYPIPSHPFPSHPIPTQSLSGELVGWLKSQHSAYREMQTQMHPQP